ncbi:MAG: TetR/AcrR family transcriptional regulator [Actinomycetota bacterium]|nr:TetR/AcrR family transcriptional regulator [Actinomycetota bacterium]
MSDIVIDTDRPLRADARRNRQRILESARAVFARCGPDAQIDDVAREAGVGVGTVYRHFPNKEALLVALMREKFRLFAARGREALAQDGEPFGLLVELLRHNAETAASDAAVQHALAGVGEHIWLQAAAEQDDLITVTEELLTRARRAGTIRPDIGPLDIGMLMCGVCSTMGDKPGFDWRRHLELVIDMLRAP